VTWKDLKLIVLQKVFAVTDGNVVTDDTTREYLTAMPGAANEGLQLLATAGRFIKKKAVIMQGMDLAEGDEPTAIYPVGEGIRRYDLSALLNDFYSLDADGVYLQADGHYGRTGDWTMEAGHVIVIPADKTGTWTIWYNAYPPELGQDTPDGYELPLYPEVAALLPMYIASQVYKDDDVSIAVQYRNEFEVGRDALLGAAQRGNPGRDNWTSTTGWW
jgi:hypothetical protein